MANATTPGTNGRKAYRATARRNGSGWTVIVDGIEGVAGGFSIRDLAEVETKARRHVFGHTDRSDDDISIDVHVVIPADIEQRFEVAENLIEDAGAELEKAIGGLLFDSGLLPVDVRWLLNHRRLGLYMKPLTIPNAELAEHGLDEHPEATGVRWSDHGFAVTLKCRACVDSTRDEYAGLGEDGVNDLLYGEVVCDFCDVGHDETELPHVYFGPDGSPRER